MMRGLVPTSSFLLNLIQNNFVGVVGAADSDNLPMVQEYAWLLWNYMPEDSWGNDEKIAAWSKHKGLTGYPNKTESEGDNDKG